VRPHDAQKNDLKPWPHKQWVMPPQANAECVCAMDDVLAVYRRPDDARRPQVCVDETSTQLVAETRLPSPAAPGPPARVDDAYARQGTANLCMVFAPLAGQRRVKVTERRTAVDCAQLIREVVDEPYPQAEKIVLVMDHLNTHKPASVYAAFPPAEARRRLERLEMHHTPTHGRGLDMAETELSVLARPCMDRRIPDATTLPPEIAAWERHRNAAKCRVEWRFTTEDARIQLKRLYPSIQLC
jgi:DDE superfamily endonuclease